MKKSTAPKVISRKNLNTNFASKNSKNSNTNITSNNISPKPNKNTNFTFKSSSSKNNPTFNHICKTEDDIPNQMTTLETIQPDYTKNKNTPITKTPLSNLRTNQSYNTNDKLGRINSSNSTKSAFCFKKLDHDFYVEKTENMWGKELQKIKAERKIFTNNKKSSDKNLMNFGGNNVVISYHNLK